MYNIKSSRKNWRLSGARLLLKSPTSPSPSAPRLGQGAIRSGVETPKKIVWTREVRHSLNKSANPLIVIARWLSQRPSGSATNLLNRANNRFEPFVAEASSAARIALALRSGVVRVFEQFACVDAYWQFLLPYSLIYTSIILIFDKITGIVFLWTRIRRKLKNWSFKARFLEEVRVRKIEESHVLCYKIFDRRRPWASSVLKIHLTISHHFQPSNLAPTSAVGS